eukprot:2563086-Amphidinium_carterae.1
MAFLTRSLLYLRKCQEIGALVAITVMTALRRDWRALEFASEDCRGDRDIVLAAVKQSGFALQFAAESCRGDREV